MSSQARIDEDQPSPAPSEAKFEKLGDGSTCLVVPSGSRLKIDLNELIKGGDAKRQERKLKALRDAKKKYVKTARGVAAEQLLQVGQL